MCNFLLKNVVKYIEFFLYNNPTCHVVACNVILINYHCLFYTSVSRCLTAADNHRIISNSCVSFKFHSCKNII